jgi:hypothetical protein
MLHAGSLHLPRHPLAFYLSCVAVSALTMRRRVVATRLAATQKSEHADPLKLHQKKTIRT